MSKNMINRLLHVLIAGVMVIVMMLSVVGCSVLDPLGISHDSDIVVGNDEASGEHSGDFLRADDVMTFFDNTPGEKINGMYVFLKATINATYIDELELNTAKKGFEKDAWHIVYGVINEYANEDKAIKVQKKKGNFVVGEDVVLEYIKSSFAGVTDGKSEEIAESLNTYNTMVEYSEKKKQYTMLSSDAAEFNAELVDVNIFAGKVKVNGVKVDGAVLTYQLTDMSESRFNLGKVNITLVKNETSKFGYSIAKTDYSKKGIGEPTVVVVTPAPDATVGVETKGAK